MAEKGVAVIPGGVDRLHEEGKEGHGPIGQAGGRLCEAQRHGREAAPVSVCLDLSTGEGARSLGCWQDGLLGAPQGGSPWPGCKRQHSGGYGC